MSIDRLRHMDEKLKGLPLWKKLVIGAGDVALGAALGTGCAEAIKRTQTPDPGSKTPETTPTNVVINIEDMIPVPGNFRGSDLSGKIVSMESWAETENIPLYTKAQDALMKAGQRYGIEGGTTYILSTLNLVDDNGNKQDLILGLVLNSLGQEITPSPDPQGNVQVPVSAIFFYTESDGLAFVPPGEGLAIAGGRMLPLGYWKDGEKAYLGFGVEGSGATLPVFEITQEGKLIYHDPYSGLAIEVEQNQFPTNIGKALYALVPITTPTQEPTATQVPTPEETVEAISAPTAEQLALGTKELVLADVFTFGGHEWTASQNTDGEKIWTREDGKVTLEWSSLYGGGRYNAYMFVTRSERQEGKRSLEIYIDPRYPVFSNIVGSPNEVDAFIQQVVNVMLSDSARTVLMKPDSTLRIINGGFEYWPLGYNDVKPQDLYYYGLNGETLIQKIWGLEINERTAGIIGPFVEPRGNAVQCATFVSPQYWVDASFDWFLEKPARIDKVTSVALSDAIAACTFLDPKKTSIYGTILFDYRLIKPLLTNELFNSK